MEKSASQILLQLSQIYPFPKNTLRRKINKLFLQLLISEIKSTSWNICLSVQKSLFLEEKKYAYFHKYSFDYFYNIGHIFKLC